MSLDNKFADNLSKELKEKPSNSLEKGKSGSANNGNSERELDVFISYSSLNKNVADAVVSNFEQHGIRCWYAPRDIMPGQEWVTAIHEAINSSKLFILIYTDSSNESKQVANEVALAFNSGKTLIPFRLSDTEMSTELEYYLTRVHWLDAVKPPLMQSIESLRDYSEKILKGEALKEAKIKNANGNRRGTQVPTWAVVTIIVLAAGLLAIAIILLLNRDRPGQDSGILADNSFSGIQSTEKSTKIDEESSTEFSLNNKGGSVDSSDKDEKSNTEISSDNNVEAVNSSDNDEKSNTKKTSMNDWSSDNSSESKNNDKNLGEDNDTDTSSEDHYKKAYDIQMNEEVENRYDLAFEEYMKTAEDETATDEIAQAMYELGVKYCNEDGVVLDYTKAIKLFEKAVLSGNVPAMNSMGNLYREGDGVDEDCEKAVEYYKMAADKEDVNAMMNLGSYYENLYYESSLIEDAEKALKYYKTAMDHGYAMAESRYDGLAKKAGLI